MTTSVIKFGGGWSVKINFDKSNQSFQLWPVHETKKEAIWQKEMYDKAVIYDKERGKE